MAGVVLAVIVPVALVVAMAISSGLDLRLKTTGKPQRYD